MQEIILKIRYFERGLSRGLFLLDPIPFNGYKVIKNKRGLELVSSRSSGHETSSERFLYLLYIIQAFIQALLSTAVFLQRFSFFTICLVQWLREVTPM